MDFHDIHILCVSELLDAKDNQICSDCGQNSTSIMLLEFGSFICRDCLDIHLSCFTERIYKSIHDNLSQDELKPMSLGGNTALNLYWNKFDLNYKSISYKYSTFASSWYKEFINKLVHDEYPETEVPEFEQGRKLLDIFEPHMNNEGESENDISRVFNGIGREIDYLGNYLGSSQLINDVESNIEAFTKSIKDLFSLN